LLLWSLFVVVAVVVPPAAAAVDVVDLPFSSL